MQILTFESADDAARALAKHVAEAIRAKPDLVLGLPAGNTMIPVYRFLRQLQRETYLDTSRLITFAVDEFAGVSAGDPGAFRKFLEQHLLMHFGMPPEHQHFLDGATDDPGQESRRYENAIAAAGGVDLQLLGIGGNGHVAFNEPGPSLTALTHLVTLREETRRANAAWFGEDLARVPRQALTMGMATLLRSRAIALIATGASKADAVVDAVRGPIITQLPASFLQLHAHVDIYVDRAAAARLLAVPKPANG